MAQRRPRIFLSVGRQKEAKHSTFVATLEKMLSGAGVEVVKLPNTFENPLEKIFEELRLADGALVICFERLYARSAVEFRRAEQPGPEYKPFQAPTVWNHMEAALAKAFGVPTLVIAEQGCRVEGVLDPKLQFKVHWMDFDATLLEQRYFRELFVSWIDTVREARDGRRSVIPVETTNIRVADLLRGLKVSELVALISTVVAVSGALLYAGYWFGERFGAQ